MLFKRPIEHKPIWIPIVRHVNKESAWDICGVANLQAEVFEYVTGSFSLSYRPPRWYRKLWAFFRRRYSNIKYALRMRKRTHMWLPRKPPTR